MSSSRDRVVAHDRVLFAQLADIAGEVVDEGVVIVDEQDHDAAREGVDQSPGLVERFPILRSGSVSATIPPPAWK